MKAISDRGGALAQGLADIRAQFDVPADFPPAVIDAANAAAARVPHDHVDRTDLPFVTLDPLSATDLDQAFAITQAGRDLLLHYAIADVGFFVYPGGVIDQEAWARGETFYLPDGRASLYPKVLSEGAASLLPGADKPAVLFTVRVAPDGAVTLEGVERALVRSRAKLGYRTVDRADLPPAFFDLARRIQLAEAARGAARIDPPQQEVVGDNGAYALGFRPMSEIEQANAAMSLACNMAVADLLAANRAGLFRVMREPGIRATSRLREVARAIDLDWPTGMSLKAREAGLDPNDPRHAAFMLAVRRAGEGAHYAPFEACETPWHSAVAATYVHMTAPLRRLADRYVIEAALALANGLAVPDHVTEAFPEVARIMNRADQRAGQIDAAVLDLAEAVALEHRVGERFKGRVIEEDERGAKVQLCDEAVIARVPGDGIAPGDPVTLQLVENDPQRRLTRFDLVA